jgi:PAS domain S-box-containing protein
MIKKINIRSERKTEGGSLLQLEAIVEESHDAIIGKTLEGIITSWNGGAVKMFGYSPDEVIGKSMANLFPVELKDELPRLLEKVRRGEIIVDYDSIWLRKDGTRADVEFSLSPVHNEKGEIVGASLVGRDITERKKNERHIKELDEVRNKFIAIISHQLRTPLTAVNWNIEMLLNGAFGELKDFQHKFLQITHVASVEITHRIYTLLTAMDIEEGRVRFENEDVAVDSICAAVVNEMKNKYTLKNISLEYVIPEKGFPTIEGDSEKIRTVIMSLIDNAITYTKENGKITIKLTPIDGVIRFEISDNGIGIPESEQHRVFTRFFRASNASVMQPDAFGLGLFIAKDFIGRHGGKIEFKSKEGKGSTFWFEVPAKATP